MISRLLLSPDTASGGAETLRADTVTKVVETVKPTAPAIDPEAYASMMAKLAKLEAESAARTKSDQAKADAEAREKGKLDEVILAREREIAEKDKTILERDARLVEQDRVTARSFVGKELATALSNADLVPGAADQLARLWRDELDAKAVNGEWQVKTREGKSAAEFVKATLADSAYAHFVKAGSRGGAGADATRAAETAQQLEAPRNLGEAIARVFNATRQAQPDGLSRPRGFHGEVVK